MDVRDRTRGFLPDLEHVLVHMPRIFRFSLVIRHSLQVWLLKLGLRIQLLSNNEKIFTLLAHLKTELVFF
jgi:hypothetical protein